MRTALCHVCAHDNDVSVCVCVCVSVCVYVWGVCVASVGMHQAVNTV